jgi:nitrogen fixation protein FixH
LAILCLLVACSAPAPVRQEQVVDGITIGLEAADSPKLNTAQDFLITLADAQGQPIDGASVYIDMLMPTMPMGTNRPVAADEGKGRYRAQAAYTMSGTWEITVVAEVAGAEHRAVFPRDVK